MVRIRKQSIYIIGGAKTGYNFYVYLNKMGLESMLYNFPKEYSSKKNIGKLFSDTWNNDLSHENKKIVLTSETALNNLNEKNKKYFEAHYYLREKKNISFISGAIKVSEIPILETNSLKEYFPIIAKPKSSGSTPFKFKVIENNIELDEIKPFIEGCMFQEYFSPRDYNQIAIAGYFINDETSLIAVEQLNQYPIGVSSHVRLVENKYAKIKKQIAKYLNRINYSGFIEFEFKENKKNGKLYLIDVNPRLWGWSYYYFSAIQNFEEVIYDNKTPRLKMKKEWINLPRYTLSMLHGRFTIPKSLSISFEPYIQ